MGTANATKGTERLIVKRYRLVRALGQGSMGIVWEGHDTLLDRPVALREVLLPAGLRDSRRLELTQRVSRETRQAERLRHPAIAAVHDVAEQDGSLWIVMALVRSRSLDGIVASDGPLPVERAASIARHVLAALQYAHAAGVTHGDVRPANVLVAHTGVVTLTDFGIGAVAANPAFAKPVRTPAHGEPLGRETSAFLAPERLEGAPPTPAADLWSLGATLYMAAVGRPPATLKPDLTAVPESLRAVIAGLLVREPKRRLPPEILDRMLADFEPPPAAPAPRRGRTRLLAGVAVAVVAAGAVGGWAIFRPGTGVTETRVPQVAAPSTAPVISPPPTPTPSPVVATRLKLTWFAGQGWRAAVPKEWTAEPTDYSHWWLDPAGKASLNVEVNSQPGTDPVATLHEAEAILYPSVKNYSKLRLKAVADYRYGTAADWEFTWKQRKASAESHLAAGVTYHQFRRVISTSTGTSVLTWTTNADDWPRLRPTLVKVLKLYEPQQL
ncbi:serine/threonine protein kinase [Streptosporangiaceae bacterium NEAU-GS5]|nr:serine/threonine protein kinase [Streptosporangiaceae bacterium NEAU-GS5]